MARTTEYRVEMFTPNNSSLGGQMSKQLTALAAEGWEVLMPVATPVIDGKTWLVYTLRRVAVDG